MAKKRLSDFGENLLARFQTDANTRNEQGGLYFTIVLSCPNHDFLMEGVDRVLAVSYEKDGEQKPFKLLGN